MSNNTKSKKNNFVVQGSILAVAGIIVRLIGMLYRIPLQNRIGDDFMGIYSAAFQVYNILLLLSSYSLPLAVSKMISARLAVNRYRDARKVFRITLIAAFFVGKPFLATTIKPSRLIISLHWLNISTLFANICKGCSHSSLTAPYFDFKNFSTLDKYFCVWVL